MRSSIFNIIETIGDGILLYNTNSNGILKLNKEYEEKYNEFLQSGKLDDEAFKSALLKGNMVIDENSGDEIDTIFLENKMARFGGK